MDRLTATQPTSNRFAAWPRGAAILVLLAFAALLVGAALTARGDLMPGGAETMAPTAQSAPPTETTETTASTASTASTAPQASPRDTDLQLYDIIAERVGKGENYYQVAVAEQRERDFPVRPGLAVRLPTLAHISAALGTVGMLMLAAVLGLVTVAAWWRRLAVEPDAKQVGKYALLLLIIGAVAGLKPQYLALHEVWAGLLIALALALHRPGHWHGAWIAAALALAVRELALPFVLLLGALAMWRGDRREAAGWGVLVALFGAGLWLHLAAAAQFTTPADPPSPSWLAMRGLGGWTSNIVLSSPLYHLPAWVAAPASLLPLIGWAGWRSAIGLAGFLTCAGYGAAFIIAGRDANFYWALVVMPIWFVGMAFVPGSVASLWQAARKA